MMVPALESHSLERILEAPHPSHFSFQPHQKPVCHASMFLGVSCTFQCVPMHFFPCLWVSVSPFLSLSFSLRPISLQVSVSLSFHPAEGSGGGWAKNPLALLLPREEKGGEGLTWRGSYLLELFLVGPFMGMRSRGLAGR